MNASSVSRNMSSRRAVLILSLVCFLEICRACPIECVCKWKNGKQTVECDKRDLLAIPKGIDPGTQVLNFSGNNLQTLTKEKFLKLDLINLQRIYLARCRISSIDDRTFKGLTNLVELDLSGNLLVSVPTESFVDCPSLMKLTLNSNPIKTLRRSAFSHLSYLNALELSACEISYVEEGAFRGLHSLEWLKLDDNKLSTLRGTRALPQSLRGIELQGNNWECDCHIVSLHAWLQEFSIPHTMEPVCAGPLRLTGTLVRSIASSELACLPDVSPTTFYLEIGEGRNISLLCHVRAVPEARVSWLFQGRLLQNDSIVGPGLHIIYFIEEGLEDKRSELFIYNTNVDDNGTFVCSAENNAGTILSNFTIRVIIKQEQSSIVLVPFSFEFLLILISAASVFAIITILIAIVYTIKCTTSRNLRKKRRKSRMATLSNSTKDSLLQDSTDDYSEPMKESTNLIIVDRHQDMMMMHTSQVREEIFVTPIIVGQQTSLNRIQAEQNPDLINDTGSVEKHRAEDGKEYRNRGSYGKAMENAIFNDFELHPPHAQTEAKSESEFYSLPADVHLNPIGLLGSDESSRGSFYRTLPHNRANRPSSGGRYSRDAEFLFENVQPSSCEHYCPGVRYTADGYQTCTGKPRQILEYAASSPEDYNSNANQPSVIHWPHCVPASLLHGSDVSNKSVSKRCVGAQTESGANAKPTAQSVKPVNKSVFNIKVQEVLTESPDEGYEGESGESNSNPG